MFFKLYDNISFKKHSLIPKRFPVTFDLVGVWFSYFEKGCRKKCVRNNPER